MIGITSDSSEKFETRTVGKAVGDAKLGSNIDLAILTRHEDIRVVTVITDKIFAILPKKSSQKVSLKMLFQEKLKSCESSVPCCLLGISTPELCM